MNWTKHIRALLHGSDVARARAGERAILDGAAARERDLLMQIGGIYCGSEGTILGTSVELDRSVRLLARQLRAHWSVIGPSGVGKSFFVTLLLIAWILAGFPRLWLLDPKAETVELMLRALVDLARMLPGNEGEALLSRVVYIDPFSATALPALQVLAFEPDEDIEAAAWSIALLMTEDVGLGGVGVRQQPTQHRVIECLARVNPPLPATAFETVIEHPAILERLAEQGHAPELLRLTAARIRAESKERLAGLRARAEALFRLKATRLALSAPRCLKVDRMINESIVLVRLSGPEDVSRFVRSILLILFNRGVVRRENGGLPMMLVIDEFPVWLASTRNAGGAERFADELRLARSKGVFCCLLAQDYGSIASVAPTLPDVIRSNCAWHVLFRNHERVLDAMLPVTGTRPRPPAPPWEEARKGYLDRGAELQLLREQLGRLPDRHCYLWDQRTGLPGLLMKTADLRLKASDREVADLIARASRNEAVLPVKELEESAARTQERLRALLDRDIQSDGGAPPAPPRRGRRPMGMG